MPRPEPFSFKSCSLLHMATGHRAETLIDLCGCVADVASDSLYFHLWSGLLRHRLDPQEYRNGFATWANYGLHDVVLAERLSVIDPTEFPEPEAVRGRLLEVLRQRTREHNGDGLSDRPASQPFHFLRPTVVVYPTDHRATDLPDFAARLDAVPLSSLYYHFVEARHRPGAAGMDDFRTWVRGFGDRGAAVDRELAAIYPSFFSLDELRGRLVQAVEAGLA